jgi:diguanylate cyclase (GGDEF)-like protein
VIWGAVGVFMARGVGTIVAGPHSDDYFRYDMLQPVAATVSMLLITAMTMALMWMEVSLLNARLRSLASHDSLTQLLNHGAIMKACERELSRAERYGEPISLAMIDLDHFKNVNDRHGHAVGDAVLAHVASLIAHDMRKHDIAGRYGGEEFVILMPQTDTAAATISMERLRKRIEDNPFVRSGLSVRVTVSIGIAELANHITGLESLIGASDRALYRAKRSGRNRIETACMEGREPESVTAPVIVTAMSTALQDPAAKTTT